MMQDAIGLGVIETSVSDRYVVSVAHKKGCATMDAQHPGTLGRFLDKLLGYIETDHFCIFFDQRKCASSIRRADIQQPRTRFDELAPKSQCAVIDCFLEGLVVIICVSDLPEVGETIKKLTLFELRTQRLFTLVA